MLCLESRRGIVWLWCLLVALSALLTLRNLIMRHWRWLRRTVSRTHGGVSWCRRIGCIGCVCTLEPSQTASECFAYCSTIGRILVVTMRCARLKLWSISVSQLAPVYSSTLIVNMPCKVNVMVCSSFSSSSVSVRFLCCDVGPLKAMVLSAYCG